MFFKLKAPFFSFLSLASLFFFLSCQNNAQPDRKGNSSANPKSGATIFEQNCKLCHGTDGRLGLNGAKDLTVSKLPLNERVNIITHGKNMMTPFGAILKAAEIDSVAAYTLKLTQATTHD